jgi:outer membrane protein insertion porin family
MRNISKRCYRGLSRSRSGCVALLLLGCVQSSMLCAQSNLEVEGMGFWGNRRLDARLAFLHGRSLTELAELDAALLEDSAFILIEQVKGEGYLKPVLELRMLAGASETSARWSQDYSIQLPAQSKAERAVFRVLPGVRYYYESASVEGVTGVSDAELERYFIPGGILIHGRAPRLFTPENFNRRINRLLSALEAEGYRTARLLDSAAILDDLSGAVQVKVQIDAGPLHRVGQVSVVTQFQGQEIDRRELPIPEPVGLTVDWEQARLTELRNAAYAKGYPDVQVWMERVSEIPMGEQETIRQLRFVVDLGESVHLGQVRFLGDEGTARTVLERQVRLESGAKINLLELSEARRKLMALGIYQRVGFEFDPEVGAQRDVVYELIPSQRKELQFLGGWGSYELARGGFNWMHRNPWGHAHSYEIGAKQSFKSTEVNLGYTLPQIFGTDLKAYTNADYSQREELSYNRSSGALTVGTSFYLRPSGVQLSVEYGLARELTERSSDSSFESEDRATVSSFRIEASLDRRDNFLTPSAGYNLFASVELAHPALGGTVNFQKVEFGGAYHFSLTESILMHFGLRAGSISSFGAAEDNIPFNERFFPGGENSVRGYREGGASPLDSNGDQIGAEIYLLGNLELEQRIWSNFSLVQFVDLLADAREGMSLQSGDFLYSVGLGLRYNSVVGPLRLEYGYNPGAADNRRQDALHFSIGFPF